MHYYDTYYVCSDIQLPPWHTLPWPRSYHQGGLYLYLKMGIPQNQTQDVLKSCDLMQQFYNYQVRFKIHITIIPNSSHHIPSRLTHPVQHVNSHLWLLPPIKCTHFILLKEINQNTSWHISHIWPYRPFYYRGLLIQIRKIRLFVVTPHFNHSSIFHS